MSTFSSTLTRPENLVSDICTASATRTRAIEIMKSLYQADQQAKYLNLHSEVETLLQQLQCLKQQRLAEENVDSSVNCD